MNRKLLFTSLLLAATCFLSCSKTEMDPAITPGDESSLPEIILSTSGTKAYLDGTAVKWQDGDALFVADATRTTANPVARKFDLIEGAGTSTAKFKGHGYECDKVPYWIFYPYWSSFNVIVDSGEDKYLAGYVPIGQITSGGTPMKTALVAAAYAPGEGDTREGYSHGAFTLKFLVGFLKFTVPAGQNKITRVRIQSGDVGDANRPAMSGLFKVNYPKGDDENWNKDEDFPQYGGNHTITGYASQYYVWAAHNGTSVTGAEECSKAVPFAPGKEYYLAVLAKDYSKLKIETSYQTTDPTEGYYTSWGSTDTRTVSGTITVKPGKIVDLGELTYVSSAENRTVKVSLKPAANTNVNAVWPTSDADLTVAYYSDSKNMTTVSTATMTVENGVASFDATIPKNSRKIHVIYPAGDLDGTTKPADDFVPNPGINQIMPSSGGEYAFSLNNYPIHAVKDVPVGSGTDVSNIEINYSLDGPGSGDTYKVSSTIVKFDFSKAAIANCGEKINGLTVNGYSSHFVDNSTTQVAVSESTPVLISLPNTTTKVNSLSVINPYRAEYDCDYTTLPSGSSYTAPTWTAGAVSSSSVVLSVKSRTVRIYASENNIISVFGKLHPAVDANNGLSASVNKYVYAAKDTVKIQGGNYTLSQKLEIPHGYTISGGWDSTFENQTDRDTSGGTVIDCCEACQGIWIGGTMANYPISISNLQIKNAKSDSYAGGLYAGSNQVRNEYKNLTFDTCVAKTGGGAVFSFAGTFDDIKCSSCSAGPFQNADAYGCGGAMYLKGNGTTLVKNCEITSCTTTGTAPGSGTSYLYGGGIYAHGGYVTIQNTKVTSCIAAERGGGVYLQSGAKLILILDGASVDPASYPITGNHAQYGGGLYVDGSNCEVHGVSSKILLQISGNTALLEGAGIYLNNGSKAYCCDVTGNNWYDNTRYMRGGGAVVTNGSRLYRSRINNNASCQAAGVYLIKTGYVFNCLITNNTAKKGTYGSAIGLNSTVETDDPSRDSDDIVVYNNTICNNRITDNDGIQVAVGVYRVSNKGTGPSRIQNNIILNNNGYNNVSCFALSYSIAEEFSSVNLAYNNVVKTNTPWPTLHASLATYEGNITVDDETSIVNVSGDFKVKSSATATVKEGTGCEYETKMNDGFDTDFWGTTLSAPKKYIGCEYISAQ